MNAALSHKRKQRAAVRLETGSKNELIIGPVDESVQNQPGDRIEQKEDEARLTEALNRLSPEHKAVLILKDIDGQKYEEIAEILGVPVGTVRSRLHRARLELRDLLEEDESEER